MISLTFFFGLSMWAAWRLTQNRGGIFENLAGGTVGIIGFFVFLI